MSTRLDRLMEQIEARRERERASDREIARQTGQPITQFDADVTAPDPRSDRFGGFCNHLYKAAIPHETGPVRAPWENARDPWLVDAEQRLADERDERETLGDVCRAGRVQ